MQTTETFSSIYICDVEDAEQAIDTKCDIMKCDYFVKMSLDRRIDKNVSFYCLE